ncbi:pentatricopeptide repeat-containing protein At2g34400-like [Selaginella moellendorffii]|uniref:pentatricopeptide repeat-containing protein At2g34400-like n=1 Tax=Selaginella moellendorffii TaxID=88036 RepID=UPI000D1C5A84|nr:pentatricopeptide repeat-containing protein At2g34400-like [Selaginella moellendorffii]|eukprot:XP_024543795.1 pentatricopeptide repeat-containing protein At2g34400-like [Selaginella moellendorffii]
MALFRQMQLEGIAPDRRMFVALGNAAAAARDLEQGRVIHRCAQESGYCRDSQLATAILNMYGKCGDIRSARVVFDAIAAPGVVAWTALISAHSESREISPGSSEGAILLFRSMQLQGVAPNAVTFLAALSNCNDLRLGIWIHSLYDDSRSRTGIELEEIDVVVGTALVAMYGRVGSLRSASNVFLVMPEKNTVTWNTMIAAYAQNGHHKEALGVYWRMLLDGQHRPSKVTFLGVFQACQSPQFLIHGRSIHSQSTEKGLSHDTAVATTIVSMYGKCGNLDGAREVFAGIQNRDSACWTAMIGACADNGDSASSVMLFRKMEHEGNPVRKVTLVALLNACAADSSFLETPWWRMRC